MHASLLLDMCVKLIEAGKFSVITCTFIRRTTFKMWFALSVLYVMVNVIIFEMLNSLVHVIFVLVFWQLLPLISNVKTLLW